MVVHTTQRADNATAFVAFCCFFLLFVFFVFHLFCVSVNGVTPLLHLSIGRQRQRGIRDLSLDWSREFATCDPSYYKHQQKMFLDMLAAGLAEREKRKLNWDPVDMTCPLYPSDAADE